MFDMIQNKAIEQFRSIYKDNKDINHGFKVLKSITIGGDTKDLLILGIMKTWNRYDTCIAVLNPSQEVIQKLKQGCVYTGNSLKRIVSGKCDLMIDLLVKTFPKSWEVKVMRKYRGRKS